MQHPTPYASGDVSMPKTPSARRPEKNLNGEAQLSKLVGALSLAAILGAAGCGGSGGADATTVVRDSAGIRIVEHHELASPPMRRSSGSGPQCSSAMAE